jgi:UDP-N-acetylmuramoylalanine--D-glutamate ligase
MRIAILGFGREGRSALRFLKKHPAYKSAEVWILDENPDIKVPRGAKCRLGKNWLHDISRFDAAVRSPGIYYNRPEFINARKKGVVFTSSTKLFFDEIQRKLTRSAHGKTQKKSGGPYIIGVTGSKGKSTVCALIYAILKKAGMTAHLAGNIGTPPLEILPRLKKNDWVVLELSSFQLQDLETSPHIAVITEMFPEHQDIHDTIEDYYEAKTSITKYQSAKDMVFYLNGNEITERIARGGKGKKIAVSAHLFSLFAPEDLKLNGPHQYRNAALAATVALKLGIPSTVVKKTAIAFPGLPHRVEFVRTIGTISFYNDSQSTNAYSVIAAAQSFPDKNTIIIGGGYDKNVDYSPFKRSLKNSSLKCAVLFGQNKYKIQKGYRTAGVPTIIVSDLRSAVSAAYVFARKSETSFSKRIPRQAGLNHQPSTYAIVLSPGTSSFDMFKNYAARGERFKKIVRRLR